MDEKMAYRRQRKRKKKPVWPQFALIGLFLVLTIGIIIAVSAGRFELMLTLNGENEITLEFGEVYTEVGAKATVGDREVTVSVQGKVQQDRLGSYTLTYMASHNGKTVTAQRIVHIVDTTAPSITLVHNNSITLPGNEYQEEGFIAEDNYDGVITDRVQRIVENDTVIYRVTDSSGNVAEARRQIQYGDLTAPELTLLGDTTITIRAGNKYTEPGFAAIDNADGDITDRVVITGDYDIYTPGTYSITYTVTDSYNNTSSATRTLIVEKVDNPPVVAPEGSVIYLTFDDGPGDHTLRLLKILEKYNVKATFFVVGTGNLEYLDEIAAGGHSIALHSNSHDYKKIYSSEEAFFNDLYAIRDKIYAHTGVYTTLMRFPGGSSNKVSKEYCEGIMTRLTKAVEAQGFQYFDWNVDSNDAGGAKTADEVYQNVIDGIQGKKNAIVLQHDIHGYSVDAVERIIQWGLSCGYRFEALTSSSPTSHHPVRN